MHFDLLVIGSGPAGQRAAVQASKLGKRAVVVEQMAALGGVSIHTGTIPSKTLREAVVYLTGYHQREFYGDAYSVKSAITMSDLMLRARHVIDHEVSVTREHLVKNGIEIVNGHASFVDSAQVSVALPVGGSVLISADRIVIATGSEAARDPNVPFDGKRIMTSDDLMGLAELPASLVIIGGGIIGVEYAGIFGALGIPVTLIDRGPRLLPLVDHEVSDALVHHLAARGVQLRSEQTVSEIDAKSADFVEVRLAGGQSVRSDAVLYTIGRTGASSGLNLAAAGLQADGRGRIPVDDNHRTAVRHIYAAGDVIGNPALAATSMEQGRRAACHAFDVPEETASASLPIAIYTIPEIAMVGPTCEDLDAAGVSYVAGRGMYREIARGQMLGDETGFLKTLFHTDTGRLLAVHAIGAQASELIHIGQAVMSFGGGLDYFLDTTFNYPTLAQCYKAAALDAANDLRRAGTYGSITPFVPAEPIFPAKLSS